jgi:hypothetical protein
MKFFMPTTACIERMTTPALFKPGELCIVCHDMDDGGRVQDHFPEHEVVVVNVPKGNGPRGVEDMRNAIWGIVGQDNWCCMVDDDLMRLTGPQAYLQQKHYDEESIDFDVFKDEPPQTWKRAFLEPTPWSPLQIAEALVEKCVEVGSVIGGLASLNNHFFRKRRWTLQGLIVGRFTVSKVDLNRPWREGGLEDVERGLYSLTVHGASVVEKWVYPITNEFVPDAGIGDPEGYSRRTAWQSSAARILHMYPGLVKADGNLLKIVPNTRVRFLKWFRSEDRKVALERCQA